MAQRYPNTDDAVAAILKAGVSFSANRPAHQKPTPQKNRPEPKPYHPLNPHQQVDVNCGSFMQTFAPHALANGTITEADLDVVLRRQFRLRLRLGHFDPPGALNAIGLDQICSPYALELARDAGRQSAVLAKNVGGVLPLAAGSFASAVVIGPLISLTDTIQYYGSTPCNKTFTTPLDAVLEHLSAATSIAGVPNVTTNDTSGVAAAAAAAAGADLVLLAVGSDRSLETEGHDRASIDFSPAQTTLIAAVAAAAKGPVVALVFSGGAMDVSALLGNPKVAAVVICGQPSVAVQGTLDAVFGRTPDGRAVAMAGKMSQTSYAAGFVNEVDMYDFGMRPGPSAWPPGTNPGRTYRFYTGTPVLPFGFGLSYTTWAYTPLPDPTPPATVSLAVVEAAACAQEATGVVGHTPASLKANAAQFWVNVTNTGSVDSDDVVLGFLVPPGAGANGVPLQELFGFERVFVPAGQTVTVYLGAQGVRFTQAGKDGVRRVLRGEYKVRLGVREAALHGMGFAELALRAE